MIVINIGNFIVGDLTHRIHEPRKLFVHIQALLPPDCRDRGHRLRQQIHLRILRTGAARLDEQFLRGKT